MIEGFQFANLKVETGINFWDTNLEVLLHGFLGW